MRKKKNKTMDSASYHVSGAEKHPLEPFIPAGARLLMLGSFPPKRDKWSMEFFYPNFNNDMWRIIGLIFYGDRSIFVSSDGKHFDRDSVAAFCTEKGIALYDTASEIRRLKDNASDKFLEIVSRTDIRSLLSAMPECRAIAVTGQKAAETAAACLECDVPAPSSFTEVLSYRLWRMPSSSRAYPLPLEKKAEAYRKMFEAEGFIL